MVGRGDVGWRMCDVVLYGLEVSDDGFLRGCHVLHAAVFEMAVTLLRGEGSLMISSERCFDEHGGGGREGGCRRRELVVFQYMNEAFNSNL
jgi:hypothetical protein